MTPMATSDVGGPDFFPTTCKKHIYIPDNLLTARISPLHVVGGSRPIRGRGTGRPRGRASNGSSACYSTFYAQATCPDPNVKIMPP